MKGMMGTAAMAGMILALGACESQKTVTAENASTAEVAQKVKEAGIAQGGFISPGQWQTTTTINEVKIPGMPPEMAKQMQAGMGKPRTFDHCVTEEEAKKPREEFFAGDGQNSCRYDNFTMGGGRIAMVMQCDSPSGRQVMKMDGTYSADAYHMTVASKVESGEKSPMGGMTLNATMDAKRVGVCTGKETG